MATKRSVGTLGEADLKGKKVFVCADLNVPLDDAQKITDDTRIRASIPTIKFLLEKGAKVILASHLEDWMRSSGGGSGCVGQVSGEAPGALCPPVQHLLVLYHRRCLRGRIAPLLSVLAEIKRAHSVYRTEKWSWRWPKKVAVLAFFLYVSVV
ncbi:hypothetical protein ACQ4PT_012448 [Festuca glaucescens]